MRINNNIQDQQTHSFRALVIKPEARNSIRKCTDIQILSKLNDAKSYMSNTEYFDIVVGKNLKCKLVSLKDAFFGVFNSNKYKNVKNGINNDVLVLDEYSIYRHPISENDEEVGYNIWSNKNNSIDVESAEHIDKLVEIARELDAQAVAHENRDILESSKMYTARKLQQRLLDL